MEWLFGRLNGDFLSASRATAYAIGLLYIGVRIARVYSREITSVGVWPLRAG